MNFALDLRVELSASDWSVGFVIVASVYLRVAMLINLVLKTLKELVLLFPITDLVLLAELSRQIVGLVALKHVDVLDTLLLHVYSYDHFQLPIIDGIDMLWFLDRLAFDGVDPRHLGGV